MARAVPLQLQLLHTAPGGEDITVTFRPNRTDDLHASAKTAAELAYRILFREGVVRSQVVVRCHVPNAPANVVGRSADLAFALAIPLQAYSEREGGSASERASRSVAATGVLEHDGTVRKVEHLPAKLRAALDKLGTRGVVFFPAENLPDVEQAGFETERTNGQLRAIRHLDEAFEHLGIVLERVYLRNPFRGLEHFDYEHHSIFFGRDGEVREVVGQLLRREAAHRPGVLVEGPSGSGKSSFLRAGILPTLVNPQDLSQETRQAIKTRPVHSSAHHAIWRPGLMPFGADESAVARSIRDCWESLSEWPDTWRVGPIDSLAQLAESRRAHWPTELRFVWVIDQFEEIFTMGLGDALLEDLGQFLVQLQADGVWTLASIRADAVAQFNQYGALRAVFGADEGHYYLPTLHGLALEDVINLPAKAADLTFGISSDGKRLDQLLRDEAYRERDSLPLLEFTLNELYLRRSGTELTYTAYRELGGLSGSIARTAEALLRVQPEESRRALPRLFRNLVSVDETGRATRRYTSLPEIERDPTQKELLLRLVESRLCITDQRNDEPVVAFAHDSLLRTLPALTGWLKDEGALLQTRELAQRETRLWQEHGHSKAWLAAADKAMSFRALIRAEIPLSSEVRTFIESSENQARRTARVKQAAVALVAVLAVAASVAAWVALNREKEAEYQTAQARESQLQLLTQSAAERLKDGDLTLARSIELEVLRRRDPAALPDPAAMNVLQEIRATDPALAILTGHSGAVRTVRYSPDGTRILTTADDNTARVWDARTGIQLEVLTHNAYVCSAVYSTDGRRILTTSEDGKNRVWDASSGAEVLSIQSRPDHCGRAFSVDGGRFLTSDGKVLQVWDARTGREVGQLTRPPGLSGWGDLSPDGMRFVTLADDNTARIFDVPTGKQKQILSGHLAEVFSARYSSDGHRIVTTSQDNTARIWDADSGAQLAQVGHIGMVFDGAFSPDGGNVATVSADLTARIWDVASAKQLQLLSGHTSNVFTVAYSPDGTQLVTGSGDGTARTWNLRQAHDALVIGSSEYKVDSGTYSPDGSRLMTLSESGPPRIWDAHSGQLLSEFPQHRDAQGPAVYSPDGKHILAPMASGENNFIRVWDVATGTTLLDVAEPSSAHLLAYSPDAKRIAAAFEDLGLQMLDAETGKTLIEDRSNKKTAFISLQYSPDGKRVLTGSLDNTARIYDADSLRQLVIMPHKDAVRHAAFSPDGSKVVTACHDGFAYIWDAQTGEKLQTLAGHHAYVWGAGFSPDGSRVVTGSRDQTVRIWEVRTGIELAVLTGHQGRVEWVSYAPDGKHIASTSSLDRTARVWDAQTPADWRSQITWEEAVEPDSLSDVQRTTLGIATTSHVLTSRALAMTDRSHASSGPHGRDTCSANAAAYYDPDRTAPGLEQSAIQADLALSACSRSNGKDSSGRVAYQRGRALLAKGDAEGARRAWEIALARGYRAARVDLALLLVDPTKKMVDPPRAISLLEIASKSGIATAAYELGTLYENGAPAEVSGTGLQPDSTKASFWYNEAIRRMEPHGLARAAQQTEYQGLSGPPAQANVKFLEAFTLYARAIQQAEMQAWPDSTWRGWRYRRSTLARVLAAAGRMQEVAIAYQSVLQEQH
jgi:WD40 repeat protein